MKQYVTFGQAHAHRIDGVTLDCDCVACFDSEDADTGRAKAFELFGPKFSFHYPEGCFDLSTVPRYYRRGVINILPGGFVEGSES